MDRPFARAVSVLGHPLLVLPSALLLPAALTGAPGTAQVATGCALAAAIVLGWSYWRVRQGHWAHVDASQARERGTLNRFLLVLLAAGALLALASPWPALPLRLALSAAIVALALLLSRRCRLSLHLAFAVYAAALLMAWSWWAGAAMLAFAAVVAWSRLALARHTPRDLVAGGLAGAGAGLASWALAERWPGA